MRVGFIGVGAITAAIVTGLKGSTLADWPIVLSPRNVDVARGLAASLPGVTVAASNQSVVDGSDVLVLAVRPQVAAEVLSGLKVRPDQPVISLIAATAAADIARWTGARQVCRAIPLPFVAERSDVTPVFPPLPVAMELFGALGTALPVRDQASFDLYGALSALMETYFGLLGGLSDWSVRHGLPEGEARAYLAGLFLNLSRVAATSPLSFEALRVAHSTEGGLNEQVHRDFVRNGGPEALARALDRVLQRITAA